MEATMTIRAPVNIHLLWRMQPTEAAHDEEFIARCVSLWDKGLDTKDISLIVLQYESVVERATRFGRERRRAQEGDR